MVALLKDQTFWIAAAHGLALLALAVAFLAFRAARNANVMRIPAPDAVFLDNQMVLRFKDEDAKLYGIVAAKLPRGKISHTFERQVNEPAGLAYSSVPFGKPSRAIAFFPSVAFARIAVVSGGHGSVLRVCVASRASRRIRTWINVKIE